MLAHWLQVALRQSTLPEDEVQSTLRSFWWLPDLHSTCTVTFSTIMFSIPDFSTFSSRFFSSESIYSAHYKRLR
jgi:cytosine/uracil/thiamine/allantoin permease